MRKQLGNAVYGFKQIQKYWQMEHVKAFLVQQQEHNSLSRIFVCHNKL